MSGEAKNKHVSEDVTNVSFGAALKSRKSRGSGSADEDGFGAPNSLSVTHSPMTPVAPAAARPSNAKSKPAYRSVGGAVPTTPKAKSSSAQVFPTSPVHRRSSANAFSALQGQGVGPGGHSPATPAAMSPGDESGYLGVPSREMSGTIPALVGGGGRKSSGRSSSLEELLDDNAKLTKSHSGGRGSGSGSASAAKIAGFGDRDRIDRTGTHQSQSSAGAHSNREGFHSSACDSESDNEHTRKRRARRNRRARRVKQDRGDGDVTRSGSEIDQVSEEESDVVDQIDLSLRVQQELERCGDSARDSNGISNNI